MPELRMNNVPESQTVFGVVCERELLLEMGPWLLQAPNEAFFAKWQGEIAKLEGILASLSRSELESAEEKRGRSKHRSDELRSAGMFESNVIGYMEQLAPSIWQRGMG
jgi:hypothetical protein